MSEPINFFNEIARVGTTILETLGGKPATTVTEKYLKNVTQIYNLLSKIHDNIADVAFKVSFAANMDEARETLKEIQSDSLENTFRTLGWCEKLGKLGKKLLPLIEDVDLSEDDQKIWKEFCSTIELREVETARLYDKKLYDFRMLAHRDISLKALIEKANDISEQLVIQKARFDLLAKKAETMLKRLA